MILVTGATGTNGRLVVQALLRAGAPVRAMVQNPTRAADLQRTGAQLVVADFDEPDTLDGALAGVGAACCCRRSTQGWRSARPASSRARRRRVFVTW